MPRYFVSFSYVDGGFGSANVAIDLRLPVRSMDDVRVIADAIRDQGYRNVVVLSFCPFAPMAADPAPVQEPS